MITPPNLRTAIADYLYAEFNLDDGFASNLAAGHGIFDAELKRALARVLVDGEMDFGDFARVTDNAGLDDDEVIHRLRRIWDSAFPGVDPRQLTDGPAPRHRSPGPRE